MKNRPLLNLTFQHLRRHWRLNLLVLTAMMIGSGLLAAVPMVTAVIAGQSLQQMLGDALAPNRNIQVESESLTTRLGDEHSVVIQEEIGSFVTEVVEIRDASLSAEQIIYRVDGSQDRLTEFFQVRFWSFSNLEEEAQLLEGEWPSDQRFESDNQQTLIEAAIGSAAADTLSLEIGDELAVDNPEALLTDPDARFRVRIVGIVNPVDATADTWWDDPELRPFRTVREPITIDFDQTTVSVFVQPETLDAQLPEMRSYWRILINSEAITVSNVSQFREKVLNLILQLRGQRSNANSGLPDLLAEYEAQLAQAQVSLLLLMAQSLLAVLYTLGLISAFLLSQSQSELATMAGRGFSSGQIARLFGIEVGLLAFGLALPLGPLLTLAGFQLWSRFSSVAVLNSVPPVSWLLALTAVTFGWLALMIPLYLSTRHQLIEWLRQRARPHTPNRLRQLTFDVFLLTLGGLSYWQLTQIGTAVREQSDGLATDPVLLLGPSLLTLAIGLFLLRLFPLFIQFVAWLSRSLSSFVLPSALTRLARDPVLPSQLLLLISLSAGLTFFATTFSYSINERQEAMARYTIGSDLTLRQPRPVDLSANDAARVELMPGVTAVSQLYRGQARPTNNNFSSINFLAIDPNTVSRVTIFPTGISAVSINQIAAALRQTQASPPDVLPIILSSDLGRGGLQVGDQLDLDIGPETASFEITGIVSSFPTVSRPFVITNLPQLNQQINLNSTLLRVVGESELWLATEPGRHSQLAEQFDNQTREEVGLATYQAGRLIGDRQAQLDSFRANSITRLATTAFQLNAIVLIVLGSIAFLFVQLFSARRRLGEISVLQAIGLSQRQLYQLLGIEGVIILIIGLLTGLGLGYGLSQLMRPFLSLTLRQGLGGEAIDQLLINWFQIGWQYVLLALFFALGLGIVIYILSRLQLHQTLRLGEE